MSNMVKVLIFDDMLNLIIDIRKNYLVVDNTQIANKIDDMIEQATGKKWEEVKDLL